MHTFVEKIKIDDGEKKNDSDGAVFDNKRILFINEEKVLRKEPSLAFGNSDCWKTIWFWPSLYFFNYFNNF